MKITKARLQEIIREERAKLTEHYEVRFAPEEQAVINAMEELEGLIEAMEHSNPEMTDYYIKLFRALQSAGVDTKTVAMMA